VKKPKLFHGAKVEPEPDRSRARPLFADFVHERKSGGEANVRRRPPTYGQRPVAPPIRALSRIWQAVSAFFS
jgi:hypothetical protein